tara:strand:- start:815 stop:1300 length:486 start_codon:yes stop_codon:yes gene_type:complete
MQYIKIAFGILIALSASRFFPHPPNFTSLLALSFYIPLAFGTRFIPAVIIALFITDLLIGLHSTMFFTYGSIVVIGILSKYFTNSLLTRLFGALTGAVIFFVISNFGVWVLGGYGYTISGFVKCYTMALPFFGYSIISTLFFSVIIETIYKFYKIYNKNFI